MADTEQPQEEPKEYTINLSGVVGHPVDYTARKGTKNSK